MIDYGNEYIVCIYEGRVMASKQKLATYLHISIGCEYLLHPLLKVCLLQKLALIQCLTLHLLQVTFRVTPKEI